LRERWLDLFVQVDAETEEVAETENQEGGGHGFNGNQENTVLQGEDAESTNQVQEDNEDFGEVSSNLKRKRTYAYGRCLRARL
jgi:hypothetical protein